jgi:hypothetical protein
MFFLACTPALNAPLLLHSFHLFLPAGSASASQSASQGPASSRQELDPLAALSSKASDHIDRSYHSNLDDMLAQTAAKAAAGGKRGKKKKGVKVDLGSLHEMNTDQYGRPQVQQQQQSHLPSPAGRQQQQQGQRQQQQQQQQAPVSMADFPSLDEAATAQAENVAPEKDYLGEALSKLKLGE